MKIIDVTQGSPEWFEARRGIPSASNFHRLVSPKTCKLSSHSHEYACELAGERLTLLPLGEGVPMNRAMRHGIDTEAEAASWYEMEMGTPMRQVGFCLTDDGRFGCSPDRLVGDEGGLEIKCVQPKTQVAYLLDGGMPLEYKAQVHGSLIVTGRAWWAFLSYCPGLPPLLLEVTPDEYTGRLRGVLEEFHSLYARILEKVRSMAD